MTEEEEVFYKYEKIYSYKNYNKYLLSLFIILFLIYFYVIIEKYN